jgi:hypothetical protein
MVITSGASVVLLPLLSPLTVMDEKHYKRMQMARLAEQCLADCSPGDRLLRVPLAHFILQGWGLQRRL